MKKEQQKQHLIDMMKVDEELGLYNESLDKKSYLLGYTDATEKIDDFAIGFAEYFAIGFAEWCIKKRIDFFDSTEIGETYTINGFVSKYKMSELLEMYKKEEGL
jgi:hypothetical protein